MFFRKRRTRFGNDCPICFECLDPQSTITTKCGHNFCKNCMDRWNNNRNATCPLCRTRLNPKPPNQEGEPNLDANLFQRYDEEVGEDGNIWSVQGRRPNRRWALMRRVMDNIDITPRRLFEFGKRKIKKELTIVEIKKMERYLKTV
jgi:hypothetical protein